MPDSIFVLKIDVNFVLNTAFKIMHIYLFCTSDQPHVGPDHYQMQTRIVTMPNPIFQARYFTHL